MSEPDVSELLTVAQAIDIIDAVKMTPRVVELSLGEADGLVLAGEIRADRDYPPFDKSLMDGYAVRCADVTTAPVDLRVIGEIAAGQQAARGVAKGEAFVIMTGAPMPIGADGVVPVEDALLTPSPLQGEGGGECRSARFTNDVSRTRDVSPLTPTLSPGGERGQRVRILRATSPGRFIARRGSDVRAGASVLEKGTKLNPAAIAVAASVGASRVRVFAKPRAAVLSTGDELVPIDQTPGAAQIRNSNSMMLLALLRRMGCDVTDLGIVRDDPAKTREALLSGMKYDVLFVTGGMSMGEYDYVPRSLIELGADLKITKLRIKPGKPFAFGVWSDGATEVRQGDEATKRRSDEGAAAFVFGLPGNPLAGFVCTVRLASRLIARLRGDQVRERWIEGKLTEPLPANGPREFYQPARVSDGMVTPLAWKGSADVFTLARADGLLVRGENEPARAAGDVVRVLEV